MQPSAPNWNADNAAFYTWFVQEVQEAPPHIMEACSMGLCEGYFHPKRRLSPTLWYQVLRGTGKPPEISVFIANAPVYACGEQIHLRWETKRADSVLLLLIKGYVTPCGALAVDATQDRRYRLEARNLFGVMEAEVKVRVLPASLSDRRTFSASKAQDIACKIRCLWHRLRWAIPSNIRIARFLTREKTTK